jgi:NADH-quinone oxidoreductase subunit M
MVHGDLAAIFGIAASSSAQRAFPFLTVLVLAPAVASFVVLLVPKSVKLAVRTIGIVTTLGVLALSAVVFGEFHSGVGGLQMSSVHPWVQSLGISWSLGVDGISLFLVVMSALLFPIALLGTGERENEKSFTFWLLLLESACLGSFLTTDVLVFFLFFEATLVPVYFIIAGWGHERRGYAATKFFVYTFVASAMLLVGIIALVFIHKSQTGVTTFSVSALADTHLSSMAGMLLFLAFTIAFVVKAPVFPFHTWSPDAYAEAPASGSILLAGIMAKLGTYGIVRFDLALFPHAVVVIAPLLMVLGVIGIIYGGIVAAAQRDLKRLVAYSSLAHMGFIVLGAFALTSESVSGAVLQMVNHGIYTAALFLLIAMIYKRTGTFQIGPLRGLQHRAPLLAGVFTVVVMASIGVPGLNGFIGEFLILAGTFITHRWYAVVATVGIVIAAVYMLWGYQQVFHAPESEAPPEGAFPEMTWSERAVIAPLIVIIVFLGVWPAPILNRITPTVDNLVNHVVQVGHANVPAPGLPATSAQALRGGSGQ